MQDNKRSFKKLFRLDITKDQCKDAGMAFVLIFLILKFVFGYDYFLAFATVFLVITMTAPRILKVLAAMWFGISELLSIIVSKIILSIMFFAIVTPVALVRRLMHKDSLRLCEFKKSRESVMDHRDHTFGPKDIERPF